MMSRSITIPLKMVCYMTSCLTPPYSHGQIPRGSPPYVPSRPVQLHPVQQRPALPGSHNGPHWPYASSKAALPHTPTSNSHPRKQTLHQSLQPRPAPPLRSRRGRVYGHDRLQTRSAYILATIWMPLKAVGRGNKSGSGDTSEVRPIAPAMDDVAIHIVVAWPTAALHLGLHVRGYNVPLPSGTQKQTSTKNTDTHTETSSRNI